MWPQVFRVFVIYSPLGQERIGLQNCHLSLIFWEMNIR